MFSAMEMAASLPDWTMMPLSSSSTLAFLPTGTIIADVPEGAPPLRQAYSLMKNSSSSLISPGFQRLEGHRQQHELAHAGGIHEVVGAALEDDGAGFGIHQDGVRRLDGHRRGVGRRHLRDDRLCAATERDRRQRDGDEAAQDQPSRSGIG